MYRKENGPYETADFYEFVGWSEMIKVFDDIEHHNNDAYTVTDFKEGLSVVIKNAEDFKDEETKRGSYGKYCLEQFENTAISGMDFNSKYFVNIPAMILVFGKYLGGIYVFKKIE